jgi:hypothetical protein
MKGYGTNVEPCVSQSQFCNELFLSTLDINHLEKLNEENLNQSAL